jgi:hypothetical protein
MADYLHGRTWEMAEWNWRHQLNVEAISTLKSQARLTRGLSFFENSLFVLLDDARLPVLVEN